MSSKRLAAYLRVSTEGQAEDGLGLEIQEQAIRLWTRARGFRITSWHRDAGVSGSNGLDSREALPEALQEVKQGRAGGIIVYRLDRLARDLVLQETLLREISRLGGEVFTTVESEAGYLGDDPDDPTRTLIRQIIGALGQWERSMIALRLRMGRRRKFEKKGFAYGSPPFGFRSDEGTLVPEPAEQQVLARVREMLEEGRSIRAIADALTSEGWRTKRGGTQWHPTVVARIAQRLQRDPAGQATRPHPARS